MNKHWCFRLWGMVGRGLGHGFRGCSRSDNPVFGYPKFRIVKY
ncbi:hypothetical protein HanIR_Chr11g0555941 [Helianthus annuus]|nr:hypothetical protein HanIR_Chr11g0555941 [Helianthus annuus]